MVNARNVRVVRMRRRESEIFVDAVRGATQPKITDAKTRYATF